jgi:hypothetical protein
MIRFLFISTCALLCSLSASASVAGDTFHIEWDYPNFGQAIASATVDVTPVAVWHPGMGVGDITLADGTITITNENSAWGGGGNFNGFRFTDISKVPNFTSFTVVSTTNPLHDPPALSFDGDNLIVNFDPLGNGNVASSPGGQLYTFAFTTVPEPASVVLVGLSAAALVIGPRRRDRPHRRTCPAGNCAKSYDRSRTEGIPS